jgi:ABC-type phosphate/phosphonate transport system substrate-binding protein
MRKFMFLLVLLLVGVFTVTGCKKGEKKAAQAEETGTEQKIEKEVKADLLLTEKEVQSFLKALPVFLEISKKHGKEVESLTDKENVMTDMRVLQEYTEYKEEFDAALKKYGYTFESFSATFGKVMGTFAFGETSKALGETREGMKKLLDNPLVPKESKEEVKKSLKEFEDYLKTEEGKAFKENWTIIEKYENEIKALFEKK